MTTRSSPQSRAEIASRLLAEARGQPGVAEAMRVYQAWRAIEQTARPLIDVATPKGVAVNSATSRPLS